MSFLSIGFRRSVTFRITSGLSRLGLVAASLAVRQGSPAICNPFLKRTRRHSNLTPKPNGRQKALAGQLVNAGLWHLEKNGDLLGG